MNRTQHYLLAWTAFFLTLLLGAGPPFTGNILWPEARAASSAVKSEASKSSVSAPVPPQRYLPAPPQKMTLCGHKVPLELPFVAEQMDREFNISVHDQAQVVMWMKRASRYFPYISRRLLAKGMPDDLKYLAVAESALIRKARSPAGALGLWQFIAGTGKRYGLTKNRWFDYRLDPERATTAALAYLKDLHDEFHSWPLAMAAYNCGEARVRREIKEQGVKDYFHLYLPDETMRYVYRILAVKAVLTDPSRYGYTLGENRLYKPIPSDKVVLRLKRTLHLRTLALATGSTVRALKSLNPAMRRYLLPPGTHTIRVPKGKGAGLKARIPRLKGEKRPSSGTWVVKSGETLSSIARQNGVRLQSLKRANQIRGSLVHPGQKLVIPRH